MSAFRKALDKSSDASSLLKELRSFAGVRSSRIKPSLPSFLPADTNAVLSGKKRLLDDMSLFTFSCTSCGSCCRSLPDSVLIDPYDFFLIRSKKTKILNDSSSSSSSPFRKLYGQFDVSVISDDSNIIITDSWNVIAKTKFGISPLLFLKSIDLDDNGNKRCSFSETFNLNSLQSSIPPKLTCSLGPDNMPYACSLFPLGDFFHSTLTKTFFYSEASSKQCEGLSTTTIKPITVKQYAEKNHLNNRRENSEWFRRLATAHACGGFSEILSSYFSIPFPSRCNQWSINRPHWLKNAQTASEAIELFHNKARQIWYSNNNASFSWEENMTYITKETRELHNSITRLESSSNSYNNRQLG